MKRLSYVFAALYLAVVCCSCSRELVMDGNDTPVVAVECVLVDGPVQTLKLMLTKDAALDAAPLIEDAEAVLTDLTYNRIAGRFERLDSVTWTLDYEALHEHSYRLEVKVPGYDLIWAEQTMPKKNRATGSLMFNAGDERKYYTRPIPFKGSNLMLKAKTPPVWVWAMNYNPETKKREIAEYICTDAPYVDKFNITDKFYEPHAVKGIDGNTGEIVTAYNYISLEGYPLYRRYLRIDLDQFPEPLKVYDDGRLEERYIFISGSFTGDYYAHINPNNPPPLKDDEGVLMTALVSDDYDRYIRETIFLLLQSESTDMSTAFLRHNMFTNIHGGVGIFGAKSERHSPWYYGYYPWIREVLEYGPF